MDVIELIDVKKSFDGLEVLKGVKLCVQTGQKIAIVGASGSGKTTLLSIMGTMLKPTSGRVILLGRDVTHMGEGELELIRGKVVAFVFQNGYLIEELSPLENVEIFAVRAHGVEAGRKIAREVLSLFRVPERKYVWELSGGEYQRVALARAISVYPSIILADEPTGNLDPATAKDVMSETIKICDEMGITIVLATHNTDVAAMMDKIYRLEDGVLKESES